MSVIKQIEKFNWKSLPEAFLCLAPMEDVTDTVFRQIVCQTARPDVFFTEFMNCDGFMSVGRSQVAKRLKFTEIEHPIIAQIWGIHPETFYNTAKELVKLGFDGVDINMGCPQKKILKTGGGGALIENPLLAGELINAARQGLNDAGGNLIPLSVKTRIGFKNINTTQWITFLLKQKIDALTIHGRTVNDQSEVNANWKEIKKAVKLRNKISAKIIIIGNGDVTDAIDAYQKFAKTGVDGVMIGRGIFGNPWAFDRSGKTKNHDFEERIKLCISHLQLFDKTWGKTKNYQIMKKYFKIYFYGFPGASEIRSQLMLSNSVHEALNLINEYLKWKI